MKVPMSEVLDAAVKGGTLKPAGTLFGCKILVDATVTMPEGILYAFDDKSYMEIKDVEPGE